VTDHLRGDAESLARYGRWHHEFDPAKEVERVEFIGPDGQREVRPTFTHQSARLVHDHHGYERVDATASAVTAVRFTPTAVGEYQYRALSGGAVVETGALECEPSGHHGYVEVSARDPRYFALSDGTPYCAIGLNLCWPVHYPLPKGSEHFLVSGERATLGSSDCARWFRKLAESGGNFARLWLSNSYFNAQGEIAGELNPLRFAALDAVVEAARRHGIRLKLCLENFRAFDPALASQTTVLRHPEDGRVPADMNEWFQSPAWQELWWRRVNAYLARYGDDPTVIAWELWNEINCCVTTGWDVQCDWTRKTLPEIKRRSPRNLVVNSIGSFDTESAQAWYDDFKMDEMDFQQVHRYLDQGSPLQICRHDPARFSVDAVQRTRRPDRPVLLAETGGVNDAHTGPFRFYRMDDRGIIFHDTTFPAFFAGAAGTGHIWHWESYVDQKDLWGAYRPFADLIAGIQLDAEDFRPFDLTTQRAWFLGLRGKQHVLAWARNRADSWYAVLRDGRRPAALRNQQFDLSSLGVRGGTVEVFRQWRDGRGQARLVNGSLHLPSFRYGIMLKIRPR